VVELDGPEHERDPNYGADRHRDYELLVAEYLVLRLTNAEVKLDLSRSLEIREINRLMRADLWPAVEAGKAYATDLQDLSAGRCRRSAGCHARNSTC
jgi:hypothetical protein